jgi:hypothetical protein
MARADEQDGDASGEEVRIVLHNRWTSRKAFYVRWAREFFWRTTKHKQTWLRQRDAAHSRLTEEK